MFRVEEKNVVEGKMKGMLMNETSYVNHHNFQENSHPGMLMNNTGSFVGDFDSVENGGSSSSSLTFMAPFDGSVVHHEALNSASRYMSSGLVSNPNKDCVLNVPYELGLCENLQRMHLGDEQKNSCNTSIRVDLDGFFVGFNDPLSNVVGGFKKDASSDYSVGLRQGCDVNDSTGSLGFLSKIHSSNAVYSEDQVGYCMRPRKDQGRGDFNQGAQFQVPSLVDDIDNRPWINDSIYSSQQYGIVDNSGLHSSQFVNPIMELDLGYKVPMIKHKARATQHDGVNLYPPLFSVGNAEEVEAPGCEDSFIVDGKCSKCAVDKKTNRSRGHKKKSSHEEEMVSDSPIKCQRVPESSLRLGRYQFKGRSENGSVPGNFSFMLLQSTHRSLSELKGYIHFISKHQLGCRFLQKVFDEGSSQDVQMIFTEIIDHVVELMIDPFGNYLIQKLLDFCTEEQQLQVVLMVTKRRGELVEICMNAHGTRVVQKLIETIKSRQQISLVMIALKPGLLDLMKDLNGNHVLQRCLQCLNNDQNKFIFDAAAKFCVDIASHRHGCCVLNRCIAYSSGKHREKLVTSISANGLLLAQDAFGNYVIQHIIELKIPYAAATLLSLFEGHYAYLSMQKFSSHVVEKCLRCLEESQLRIINELLSVPHFDQLLQDRFANYVIQSALEVTKGSLRALLVEAVRPYEILRTSPYCKKIFSRNLLKK